MKIAIVTNSSSYEPRVHMAADFFTEHGHEVFLVLSDFVHREKLKGRTAPGGDQAENAVFIDTTPYKRNLSLKRMYSHYDFSKKAYAYIKDKDFDLIYVLIPANSLARYMALYKKKYKKRLVIDILDLWPESFPLDFVKNIWPVTGWAALRNKYLKYADLIITECNLYQSKLREYFGDVPAVTVYWPREAEEPGETAFLEGEAGEAHEQVRLCYLGSINNIIDIDYMVKLLTCIQKYKQVKLHIIGDGEKKDELLEKLKTAGISAVFHGSVYEEAEKMKVLHSCDYGLNIMKPSVCVGVTMKSVDYMYAGLKLINNIQGDTWQMIEEYGIGYNCCLENAEAAAEKIAGETVRKEDKAAVRQCYRENFSGDAYGKAMGECLGIIEEAAERAESN